MLNNCVFITQLVTRMCVTLATTITTHTTIITITTRITAEMGAVATTTTDIVVREYDFICIVTIYW